MKINSYFITLRNRINALDKYLSNPENYKDINNPFASAMPKTYVWTDNPDKEKKLEKN